MGWSVSPVFTAVLTRSRFSVYSFRDVSSFQKGMEAAQYECIMVLLCSPSKKEEALVPRFSVSSLLTAHVIETKGHNTTPHFLIESPFPRPRVAAAGRTTASCRQVSQCTKCRNFLH